MSYTGYIKFTTITGIYLLSLDNTENLFSACLHTNPSSVFSVGFYGFLSHKINSKNSFIHKVSTMTRVETLLLENTKMATIAPASIGISITTAVGYLVIEEVNRPHESHENLLNREHVSKVEGKKLEIEQKKIQLEREKFKYQKEQDKYESTWFSTKK
jgi:hypothetical protein